jgi:hypothetical protein
LRTLILAGAILMGTGLIAAAVAGRFSEDLGTRLRRECESVLRQVPASEPERFVRTCILLRAGITTW